MKKELTVAGDSSAGREKTWGGGLLFWKKKCFQVGFEGVQRGFLSDRKGKDIPCRGAVDRKGSGTESGKSGTGIWRLRVRESEAERSVREGVEVEDSHSHIHTYNDTYI